MSIVTRLIDQHQTWVDERKERRRNAAINAVRSLVMRDDLSVTPKGEDCYIVTVGDLRLEVSTGGIDTLIYVVCPWCGEVECRRRPGMTTKPVRTEGELAERLYELAQAHGAVGA